MSISSPAHFAAFVIKQVFHFCAFRSSFLLKIVVHVDTYHPDGCAGGSRRQTFREFFPFANSGVRRLIGLELFSFPPKSGSTGYYSVLSMNILTFCIILLSYAKGFWLVYFYVWQCIIKHSKCFAAGWSPQLLLSVKLLFSMWRH